MASTPAPAEPKKGGGRFATIFSARRAKPAAMAPAAAPVVRDLQPPRSPPAGADDDPVSPGPSSLSAGSRSNQTLSTASTLAQPYIGTALDLTSTTGSAGSSATETMQSPMPPFGSQRKLFFPITVLAAPVLKKAFATLPSGQDAPSQAGLSIFAHARGDWKKRVVAISYWTAQTRNVSAVTGEEEGLSFGWLHLFKQNGPTGKEVGRMRIGYNSLVGLLDPSTAAGEQAEGRKHVLSFTAGKRPKMAGCKRVKEVFGEAEERLVIQMDSEETLQAWVAEIKTFLFIKRAEMRGIGNAARAFKKRGDVLSGDIEIVLANLMASEAKKQTGGRPSGASSVLSTESAAPAASRPDVPETVVEAHEPSASEDGEQHEQLAVVVVGGEREGPTAGRNSAQAAALATDSLQQLLTESQLPTSLTSSSLGSSTAPDLPAVAAAAASAAAGDHDDNDHDRGPSPTSFCPPAGLPLPVSNRRPAPSARGSMPSSTDLSYSFTWDAQASPLPAFGCLRAALIPIAVLAAEVDKKAGGGGGHGLDHLGPLSFLPGGGRAKLGVWRRRHLVLTSWNAVTDTRRSTFGCLHLFDKGGPSAREVGRLMLHASTLVGWLDASTANGQEADGRKCVLSVLPKPGPSAALDVSGEIDGRLLADMADETTLKSWIAELKKLAFIKRAETKGLGDLARNAKGQMFGDDLDHALHLLSGSTLGASSTIPDTRSGAPVLEFSSPGGRKRSLKSIPQEPSSAGERSEVSVSDHSSYQLDTRSDSSSSLAVRLRELSSVPMSRNGLAPPSRVSRPVLIGSSNADVSRFIYPAGTLPRAGDTADFTGSPEPTAVSPRAAESDYRAVENMLAQRLHPRSPLSDRFSSAGDSVRTHVSAECDTANPHRAEIERLRRVEVELRQQLEIERLRAVETSLRAELEVQRRRREEDERRQMLPEYDDDGLLSDDSDVDPRGPTPRHRSVGSSTYSRGSFAGQSDLSAWDAGRQERQNSTATTIGSSVHGSDKECGSVKASPLSLPLTSLSRQPSSRFSSGPSTPLDEEEAASYMRPRSSPRCSYLGSRPSGLIAGDKGLALSLASPIRPTKFSLGPPPAPPPVTLPPPPSATSAEMGRNLSDPGMVHETGTRSYTRRPSATLATLNERPTGFGRGRTAMLRQFAIPPITVPPPSGPLPVPK